MAKSVRVVVNPKAVAFYLKGGGGVRELLESKGDAMKDAVGDGIETETYVGKNRMRVSVFTATAAAAADENANHTLTASLDAAR